MYLVVGATGRLGGQICQLLAAKDVGVKGLVRSTSDQAKVEKLKGYGVEVVEGNMCDRASLEAACQRVTVVIATVSSMPVCYQPGENDIRTVDKQGYINLIDTAVAAGVDHFVYTSFTMDNEFPLRNAKRSVEQYLKDSGLTYTILRPGYFMETWLSPAVGFDYPNAKAQIFGSGENPISWISSLDVVKFAVESLHNPAAVNAVLPLGGPEAVSPLETVKIFEEIGGQSFEVQNVPESALEEQLNAATDPMQQSFTGLMLAYALGDPIDMQETLKAFPVELTSVRNYAHSVLIPV